MFQSPSGPTGLGASRAVVKQQSGRQRWRQHVMACCLAASVLTYPLHATAAYTCAGKVTLLQHGPEGDVTINLRGEGVTLDYVRICNVTFAVGSIQPAHCKSILALLMTAQVTDRPLTFWFDITYSGPPKCSNADHPSWTYLTGWYWGPAMTQ
jgi:hypothetical protein